MTGKNDVKKKDKKKFAGGTIKELKKVTWPTKKEVAIYSIVVVTVIIILAIIIGIYDLGIARGVEWLLKLKG